MINGTVGNDVVLLYPGEYTGPCDAQADLSDVAAEETAVGSLDPADPAVFVGSAADYVLRFTGERMLLLEVAFRDLPAGVDAVRVDDIRELWVKRVVFEGGDRGIVHDGVVEELRVVESSFLGTARPIDLGCGGACPIPLIDVSGDLVVGGDVAVTVGEGTVGNVLDNVVVGVGTGVIAGSGVEVRGNLLEATGLALGGAPAEVQANVVLGPVELGPGAVLGNTFTAGVTLSGGGRFEGNAVVGAIPDPGGPGNVACDDACFTDASGWDFYPAPASPLREAGAPGLGADWCGRVRNDVPTAGAIEAFTEASFGPLGPVFKDDVDCSLPDDPPPPPPDTSDTGAPPPPPTPDPDDSGVPPTPPKGCCATADGPGNHWMIAVIYTFCVSRRKK